MIIGFNNGVFNRLEHSRYSDIIKDRFESLDCNAIEVFALNEDHLDILINTIPPDHYSRFSWVSLHAPSAVYKDTPKIKRILEKIRKVVMKFNMKNIVFHPDKVKDWHVFESISDLPVSFENMDNYKKRGKTFEEMEEILIKGNYSFTLDVQHCFTLDSTMENAREFISKFKDRIIEIHISAFDPKKLHYPLYKMKQDVIIDSIRELDVPIIIESTFDSYDEIEKELDYIRKRLE